MQQVFRWKWLTCLAIIGWANIVGVAVYAETIHIRCSNQKIAIDTDKDELRIDTSAYNITWSFDGEWIRTVLSKDQSRMAFNIRNGWVIQGGKSKNAGCQVENMEVVESLPLSPGSYARTAFLALPKKDRRSVQARLKDAEHYEGQVDALWGSDTFRALTTLSELGIPEASDLSSVSGAASSLRFILSDYFHTNDMTECNECSVSVDANGNLQIEDGEFADIGEHPTIQTSTEAESRCGAHPFNDEKWIQENSRKFDVWAVFDQIKLGDQLAEQGKTREAEKLLEMIVEDHQLPDAQFALASLYFSNLNDHDRALPLYHAAAVAGDPNAAFIIALYYFKLSDAAKSSARRDNRLAYQCLEYSARNGSVGGMTLLSAIHYHDPEIPVSITTDFPRDLQKARHWIEQALKVQPTENRDFLKKIVDEIEATEQEERQKKMANLAQKGAEISQKCGSAFTMNSVCLALNGEEFNYALAARGYLQAAPGTYENDDGAKIWVSDDKIKFSCKVFGVCGLSLREVAEAIKNSTSLTELKYDQSTENYGGTSSFLYESYCGLADTGEKVCARRGEVIGLNATAVTSYLGLGTVSISIDRNRLGKGSVSFD